MHEKTPLEIYREHQARAALMKLLAADQARRVAYCLKAWAEHTGDAA